MTSNNTIYLENITKVQSAYAKQDMIAKQKLSSRMVFAIHAKIKKNHILRDNIVCFQIRIPDVMTVNGSPISPEKYLASPEFKEEVNKTLHAKGSSALSVDCISASCRSLYDIESQDKAKANASAVCCCCCPCFFIPYTFYSIKRGKPYYCVVRLTINHDVVPDVVPDGGTESIQNAHGL